MDQPARSRLRRAACAAFAVGLIVATVGFASIVVGLVAIVGLAIGSGWLTRLAGAVAVVGFILFAIEVYRSSADDMIGIGAWLALAGGIVTLIAGFFGPRHVITGPTNTVVVDE